MIEKATFAGGCFWCTEAIFQRLKGVLSVTPGYCGGQRENPTYEQIHSGATGHAESIQIEFDPQIISYDKLLDVFWHTHNPTTKDRQGADVGNEYRSAIFFHSPEQQEKAEASKVALELSGLYKDPIVTEITPFIVFYPAEKQHLNFYEKNRNSPYCMFVIDPKIQKLLQEFGQDVKEDKKL